MSDLIANRGVSDSKDCPPVATKPVHQKIATREAHLGGDLVIHRALPTQERRMIGAWCFLDHFGPFDLRVSGLDIAPHPHMGLQTFTWLIAGNIMHKDSLGNEQMIQPGEVNLMTSGHGISHSEQSVVVGTQAELHGVQLWIALPDGQRNSAPEFHHYQQMPVYEHDNLKITVLAGEFFGVSTPINIFSPLLGLDIAAAKKSGATVLPLQAGFEYGVMVLRGSVTVDGEMLQAEELLYLGCGRTQLTLEVGEDAHLLLIGGEPFKEEILVWWNFVARTKSEMGQAVVDWETGTRFGEVLSYGSSDRLEPPAASKPG
jgi:redox-sensitive bicupin YhaK (pirin superfamily)